MQPVDEWRLPTQHLAQRVLLFDQLESTNSYAAGLAHDPANAGLAVLARIQSAGRGQHGRSWQCPEGMGVLLSLLLFPPANLRRPVLLAAWVASSICTTIERTTNLQAFIKWPNDILIQGRKVCGILIEQAQGTVVGIGLNVHQPADAFARAGLPQAASLEMLADRRLDRDHIARVLLEELDRAYGALLAGNLAELEVLWQQRLGLAGKTIEVECVDCLEQGRLVDMTFAGLEIADDQGRTRLLSPERVKHIRLV